MSVLPRPTTKNPGSVQLFLPFYSPFLGFKQPVQMLSHLVYAAAEIDALQFIELIFSSSAGRPVFDAYKNNSTLPEVIAKNHGNEQTARYLKDVNERYIFMTMLKSYSYIL